MIGAEVAVLAVEMCEVNPEGRNVSLGTAPSPPSIPLWLSVDPGRRCTGKLKR